MKKLFFAITLSALMFSCSNEVSQEDEAVDNNSNNLTEASNNANATGENQENEKLASINKTEASETDISTTQVDGDGPEMTFTETEYDFGNINEGDKVAHTFVFTNTGKAPLIIKRAQGSCGCTVPEYPKEPIAPGKEGKIHVEFNSANKSGKQNKSVTLTTNMNPDQKVIYIKANVASKNDKGAPFK